MDYLVLGGIIVVGVVGAAIYHDSQMPKINTPAYNESVAEHFAKSLSENMWYMRDTVTGNCFAKYGSHITAVDCATLRDVKVYDFSYTK